MGSRVMSSAPRDTANWCPIAICLIAIILASMLPRLCKARASGIVRESAFVGYSEKEIQQDASSEEFVEEIANEACIDEDDACDDWARKGECIRNEEFMSRSCRLSCSLCLPFIQKNEDFGKNVTLNTAMGQIPVQLLWDRAPEMCQLIIDLARKGVSDSCSFYRNEESPEVGSSGPPYGLLQGVCPGLPDAPPKERSTSIQRGHVATIHPGKDFYIALIDHEDWSSGHTVWGFVEDLSVVSLVVAQPYTVHVHEVHGTEMRMLDSPVRFSVSTAAPGGD